jgi:hypothetical protein
LQIPDLILKFNFFIPFSYELFPLQPAKGHPVTQEKWNFVKKKSEGNFIANIGNSQVFTTLNF